MAFLTSNSCSYIIKLVRQKSKEQNGHLPITQPLVMSIWLVIRRICTVLTRRAPFNPRRLSEVYTGRLLGLKEAFKPSVGNKKKLWQVLVLPAFRCLADFKICKKSFVSGIREV